MEQSKALTPPCFPAVANGEPALAAHQKTLSVALLRATCSLPLTTLQGTPLLVL